MRVGLHQRFDLGNDINPQCAWGDELTCQVGSTIAMASVPTTTTACCFRAGTVLSTQVAWRPHLCFLSLVQSSPHPLTSALLE